MKLLLYPAPTIMLIRQLIPADVSIIFQVVVSPAPKKLFPEFKYTGVVLIVKGDPPSILEAPKFPLPTKTWLPYTV